MNKDSSLIEVVYYNRRFIIMLCVLFLASLFLAIGKLDGAQWMNTVLMVVAAYSATYFKTGAAGQR